MGSVAEEEHERGVAHIVEHLAFNATEVRSALPQQEGPSSPPGAVHAPREARMHVGRSSWASGPGACGGEHRVLVGLPRLHIPAR